MPFEDALWKKAEELRGAFTREEITEEEFNRETDEQEQDWEKRKAAVNEQLGVDVLRHKSLQELVEKELYSSDEKMPDQQNRLLSLVTYKKVAERARAMADQMPAGEERDVVLSVYNDARDTVWQGTLKYVEVARVNDLQTYGYTMRSDGPNQMRANENLLRAGVITQEEFDQQIEDQSEKIDKE